MLAQPGVVQSEPFFYDQRSVLGSVTLRCMLPLLLAPAAAGCGGGTGFATPVAAEEWKAVTADWLSDGRISGEHSCAAIVVARSHVSRRTDPQLARALVNRAHTDCDSWGPLSEDLSWIKHGMSNREVATRAGAPVPWLSSSACWYYNRYKPNTSIAGYQICFDVRGHVTHIRTSQHL
jgi:hypothetical protein